MISFSTTIRTYVQWLQSDTQKLSMADVSIELIINWSDKCPRKSYAPSLIERSNYDKPASHLFLLVRNSAVANLSCRSGRVLIQLYKQALRVWLFRLSYEVYCNSIKSRLGVGLAQRSRFPPRARVRFLAKKSLTDGSALGRERIQRRGRFRERRPWPWWLSRTRRSRSSSWASAASSPSGRAASRCRGTTSAGWTRPTRWPRTRPEENEANSFSTLTRQRRKAVVFLDYTSLAQKSHKGFDHDRGRAVLIIEDARILRSYAAMQKAKMWLNFR